MQLKSLRQSTLAIEGPLKISQSIKILLFLDVDEMKMFLEDLDKAFSELLFFNIQGVVKRDQGIYSSLEFFHVYKDYIHLLQNGEIPQLSKFHPFFSSALSVTSSVFYEIAVDSHERIIKPNRPVVQFQPHHLVYSDETGSLYSTAYSEKCITFGLQFSYPNLYQDPHTHEIMDVGEDPKFPNSKLFEKMRLWVREHTLPTPFMIKGKKINYPIRLGRKCFSWINKHPQLSMQDFYVHSRNT